MAEEHIQISCADGVVLHGTSFSDGQSRSHAVVIASAMGVPRRFYAPLARYLAQRGVATLTFDYRGIGDWQAVEPRGSAIRMEDWGRLDIDAALTRSLKEFTPSRLFLLGHSAGGQLAGLAENSTKLAGMVFAGVSSAYWGHWPAPRRLGILALMYAVVPALSAGREFYPAMRGGLSPIAIPSGVTSQWARWARKPGYLFDPAHRVDLSGYRKLSMPLLAYQFDDDTYAPLAAHEAILAAYPNAAITRRRIESAQHGGSIGHFGYFRERMKDTLWRETADWLLATG